MKHTMVRNIISYLPISLGIALCAVAIVAPDAALAQRRQDFLNLQLPILFPSRPDSFFDVLRLVVNFFLLIGGLTAFFYVLYGGFIYLTAGGDQSKADQGRKYIVNAIIGVVIIFLSFSLINFVINRIPSAGGGRGGDLYTLAK